MDLTIIFFVLIIAGIGAVIFLLLKKKPESEKKDDSFLLIEQRLLDQKNQIDEVIKTVDKKLSDINEIARSELTKNSNVIKSITEEMVKFGQTGK